MKINLVLLRHGESLANQDHQIYYKIPDNQIPLTEKGKEQAKLAGKELQDDSERSPFKIIHSPWQRAKDTALEVSSIIRYSQIIEDPLIFEISLMHSFVDMKTRIDFISEEKDSFGFFWYKEGTSESYADVYQRARLFVQDLKLNKYDFYDNENVLIVSHGVFLNMVRAVIHNYPIEKILKMRWLENCQPAYETLTLYKGM